MLAVAGFSVRFLICVNGSYGMDQSLCTTDCWQSLYASSIHRDLLTTTSNCVLATADIHYLHNRESSVLKENKHSLFHALKQATNAVVFLARAVS